MTPTRIPIVDVDSTDGCIAPERLESYASASLWWRRSGIVIFREAIVVGGCGQLVKVHGCYDWEQPEAFAREIFAAMKGHFGYIEHREAKKLSGQAVRELGHTDWVQAQRGWIGGGVSQVKRGSNWRLSIVGPMTRNQHKRLPNPPVYLRQSSFEERGITMLRAMRRWV